MYLPDWASTGPLILGCLRVRTLPLVRSCATTRECTPQRTAGSGQSAGISYALLLLSKLFWPRIHTPYRIPDGREQHRYTCCWLAVWLLLSVRGTARTTTHGPRPRPTINGQRPTLCRSRGRSPTEPATPKPNPAVAQDDQVGRRIGPGPTMAGSRLVCD